MIAELMGQEIFAVSGGVKASPYHDGGYALGKVLGSWYQGAIDYTADVIFPYWLD